MGNVQVHGHVWGLPVSKQEIHRTVGRSICLGKKKTFLRLKHRAVFNIEHMQMLVCLESQLHARE